jgi:cytochrome b6-f complex iron-sulfur subunit
MPEEATTHEMKLTRREFLHYTWASSMALFMVGSGGATLAFLYPRFKEGEFGGEFDMGSVDDFEVGSVTPSREGKFFLVRLDDDFIALYQVCTHLGCLVRDSGDGYSCPCHGSKFAKSGQLLASPAPRDMDQFLVEVTEDGQVIVDTGVRIKGETRSLSG